MAHSTLRQAIQMWQQRLDLTGMGLVETTLEHGHRVRGCTIDATLAHLARRTPSQFTVELSYPWGNADGDAGALLGFFPDACTSGQESSDSWPQVDAA